LGIRHSENIKFAEYKIHDMRSSLESIGSLLNPKSVAIIGASEDPSKLSGLLIPNLLRGGFKGKIYPVNPRRDSILGFTCYRNVKEIPDEVDAAVIAVPQPIVPQCIEECAEKRVKVAVVVSAGFGETGEAGKKLEQDMIRLARKADMRICGPNCEGCISMTYGVRLSTMIPLNPKAGDIAVITQSGGIGEFIISALWNRGIGISHWISTGNEADLTLSDYLEFLVHDEHTRVIVIFVEGIRNGMKFKKVARMAMEQEKPIVALKVGKSEKGKITALSHTGALSGVDEVYDAVFKQFGVVRVNYLEDLIVAASAFSWQPPLKGNRICVISLSGGMACLWADNLSEAGLELPNFSDNTIAELKKLLPSTAVIKNPLDLTAVAFFENIERLDDFLSLLAEEGDAILLYIPDLVLTDEKLMEILIKQVQNGIIRAAEKLRMLGKPFFLCTTSGTTTKYSTFVNALVEKKIPVLSPREVVVAVKAMWLNYKFRRKMGECG